MLTKDCVGVLAGGTGPDPGKKEKLGTDIRSIGTGVFFYHRTISKVPPFIRPNNESGKNKNVGNISPPPLSSIREDT